MRLAWEEVRHLADDSLGPVRHEISEGWLEILSGMGRDDWFLRVTTISDPSPRALRRIRRLRRNIEIMTEKTVTVSVYVGFQDPDTFCEKFAGMMSRAGWGCISVVGAWSWEQ